VPEVQEEVVNVKLAEVLSRDFGIDARAERRKSKKRPDIRCYYKGLIIGIEASYERGDAERDAEERLEQGLADITLALWIKEKFKDLPEQELSEAIRRSKFWAKILVPRDVKGTLLQFLEGSIERKAEPVTEWFKDVDLPTIKTMIENSVAFMIREEEVKKIMEGVRTKFDDFIAVLGKVDRRGDVRENLYNMLYKLYGLSIAEAKDPEIVFGHAALSILLSAVFYEHMRDVHPELKPLSSYVENFGPIEGLKRALEGLLEIDYREALRLAVEVLNTIPLSMSERVRDLVDLAIKITSNRGLLRRDFAGRLYHEITGDIALKKGFATFYTEVPTAYLLATLAASVLLDLDKRGLLKFREEEARKMIDGIRFLKIGDLACGSGTLLTASYSALMRIATALKFYYELEDVDLDSTGKTLIEEGIYGIDALRYASQITAINLALIGPGTIEKENIHTIYLGYLPEGVPGGKRPWLGSLELLNNATRVGGLLPFLEGGLRGVVEKVTLQEEKGEFSIPSQFDMIIMNPPFTRATGRGEEFKESAKGKEGLFGFIVEEYRDEVLEAYKKVRSTVREELRGIAKALASSLPRTIKDVIELEPKGLEQYLSIGQAGEGLLFLHLAYKYVKQGGVIAFVLPRGLLAATSWFLARALLASKFHVKYVIISNDPKKGYNFSEGTSLSETLIVAKKVGAHHDDETTVFVNLLSKPSTALEALMLADEIVRGAPLKGSKLIEVGESKALIYEVKRKSLLNNLDNWNRLVALPDPELLSSVLRLLESGELPYLTAPRPSGRGFQRVR
jgi:hypothetical protein